MAPTPDSTANTTVITTAASTAAPTNRGQCQTIDLRSKIALIDGHWQPRVVAEMNDYQFKVVKLLGDFEWHLHADTDETSSCSTASFASRIAATRRARM